jgi:2Fe-2S iron-sulfur cluster binding domain
MSLLRIKNHPILGQPPEVEVVSMTFDGKEIEARAGEPIAASLLAAGVRAFRTMAESGAPRGVFTGVGRSIEELGTVDGEPDMPLMSTASAAGMVVTTQQGLGRQGTVE